MTKNIVFTLDLIIHYNYEKIYNLLERTVDETQGTGACDLSEK